MKKKIISMKTVLLVASTLGRDGTSQFITYFINNMSNRRDLKIKVLFFRQVPDEFLDRFNERVDISSLNIQGALYKSYLRILKRIIEIRPNYCLLGFHQLVLFSFLRTFLHLFKIKILIRDTIIPSLFHKEDSMFKKYLVRTAYKKFDYIIAQSNDMKSDLINHWKCDPKKIVVINNPVDVEFVRSKVNKCPDELLGKKQFVFIAAGRLAYQKGYDILIDRIAEMSSSVNFKIFILGSGELETQLRKYAKEKGVDEIISFLGYRNDVASYIYYADALILCSRYEGFPNIVLEANSLGKPVFTNNCQGGINEILVDGQNGIVSDFSSTVSFQEGICKILNLKFDTSKIISMTSERYGISTIFEKYHNFLSCLQ